MPITPFTLEFEIEMALKQIQMENKREYRVNSYQLRAAEAERRRLEKEWDKSIREDRHEDRK